jgi:hypothetical protein
LSLASVFTEFLSIVLSFLRGRLRGRLDTLVELAGVVPTQLNFKLGLTFADSQAQFSPDKKRIQLLSMDLAYQQLLIASLALTVSDYYSSELSSLVDGC